MIPCTCWLRLTLLFSFKKWLFGYKGVNYERDLVKLGTLCAAHDQDSVFLDHALIICNLHNIMIILSQLLLGSHFRINQLSSIFWALLDIITKGKFSRT